MLTKYRGKWCVKGSRKSTGYDAKAEWKDAAERRAREIIRNAAPGAQTCSEIMSAYLYDMPLRANPKEPSQGVIYAARAALSFFGSHAPGQITREECRAYIARRRSEGRSPGTIRKELGALAAALRWHDPATPARFDLPAVPQPRERFLTRAEFSRLETVAEKSWPHLHTFLHLAIATGGRKEALLGLTWAAGVDFEKRLIDLGFKQGGKGRSTVPMTDRLFEVLSSAREVAISAYVIEWAGEPIKDIKKALRTAYTAAGLSGVQAPAHVLRHTAGAWMAMAGVPMLEISRRLGHSSIQTTERHYAHLHPDYMKESTKALEV